MANFRNSQLVPFPIPPGEDSCFFVSGRLMEVDFQRLADCKSSLHKEGAISSWAAFRLLIKETSSHLRWSPEAADFADCCII